MNVSILDFGAVEGGKVLNTDAIQRAIDTVSESGGGRVTIPAGLFLTGTIYLKDHIELHLEIGAVLKASEDISDYNPPDAYPENFGSPKEEWSGRHLIICYHKKDVAITGLGVIDGSGDAFYEEPHRSKSFNYIWGYGIAKAKDKENLRPGQLLVFLESEDILLTDVTIQNSPCWTVFLHGSENIRVRGVKVLNDKCHANTDGIDIDTCRFVTVSDCIIRTGDDAITVRASCARLLSGKSVAEHIAISNCILSSSAMAVRIGVGNGTVRNVKISGLVIERAACITEFITSYKKRGGVSMSDILVENIVADNISYPFQFIQENGAYVRNISIRTIRAKAMCSTYFVSDDPGLMSGISIRDMSVDIIPSIYVLDERAPDEKGWYAVWGKGAKDVELDSISIRVPADLADEWKGLYQADNCENVSVTNCNFLG